MKAKDSPGKWLCLGLYRVPDGAWGQRLEKQAPEEESDSQSTGCVSKCGKYIEGYFTILLVNLEGISDRYAVTGAKKTKNKMRYLLIPGKTRNCTPQETVIFHCLAQK